jgi:hypothetical protein
MKNFHKPCHEKTSQEQPLIPRGGPEFPSGELTQRGVRQDGVRLLSSQKAEG